MVDENSDRPTRGANGTAPTDIITDDCDRSDNDESVTDATQAPPTDPDASSSTHESERTDDADPGSHLTDIPDGAGCTEIWEHLSDERDEE